MSKKKICWDFASYIQHFYFQKQTILWMNACDFNCIYNPGNVVKKNKLLENSE